MPRVPKLSNNTDIANIIIVDHQNVNQAEATPVTQRDSEIWNIKKVDAETSINNLSPSQPLNKNASHETITGSDEETNPEMVLTIHQGDPKFNMRKKKTSAIHSRKSSQNNVQKKSYKVGI